MIFTSKTLFTRNDDMWISIYAICVEFDFDFRSSHSYVVSVRCNRFFLRFAFFFARHEKEKKNEMCDLYKRRSALWFSRWKFHLHETMICELRFMRYVLNSILIFVRHTRTLFLNQKNSMFAFLRHEKKKKRSKWLI